jgi:copper transport protein
LILIGLGLVATPLSIGFQGLDALGVPLSDMFDIAVWKAGFGTSFGRSAVIAMLAFSAALLASAVSETAARFLSAIALLGVGAALASSGHASAAEPRWLTTPMVFLHGAGIAFWAGALVPLGVALKRHSPKSIEALRRFSKAIPLVVVVLAIAGIVLAIIQVETPAALLATAYGKILLEKLALLGLLFALAVFNRWALTAPAERGDPSATRRLIRSITAETVIIILIFMVAAAWRFTPPPRALAIAAAQPASVHMHSAKAMVELKVVPGHTGIVETTISIGSSSNPKQVTLVLSKPSSGIEPIRRPAQKVADGRWKIDDMVIPVAGTWTVRIDLLISDFEMARLQGELEIRP